MDYLPFCNTEISFLDKEEMKRELLNLNLTNIVLILQNDLAEKWDIVSFIEDLKKRNDLQNGSFTWIKEVEINPTPESIVNALEQIGTQDVNVVVAIGGGSSIDLAKAISLFHDREKNVQYTRDEITNIINNKMYKNDKFIDIIAIPTTAGTGTEVTQWATIWDVSNNSKLSIDHPFLKPKKAIIVPELTLSVPPIITLATGLDALSHAIEAYWSKHTTPMVQEIAYRAIELIIQNLSIAIHEPNNFNAREKLCRASVLSGLAFSQTRTTACHSISYPLTMMFGMPHGLAASITLDPVGKINKGHFPNDEQLFALFCEYNGINNWIKTVYEGLINLRLSSFGISEKDIPIIVNKAFTSGRMDNNPVELSKNDVVDILISVL